MSEKNKKWGVWNVPTFWEMLSTGPPSLRPASMNTWPTFLPNAFDAFL